MQAEATISADIIDSTYLDSVDLSRLRDYLIHFVNLIEDSLHLGWGRIVRGDGVEFVVGNQHDALRLALLLRAYIKAFDVHCPTRAFKKTGIRIAVGLGGLRANDRFKGIIDGESIYNSGRALGRMTKDKFVIVSPYRKCELIFRALSMLLGALLDRATAKQCHVLFMRLQGMTERQIADRLGVSPIAVWGHLNKVGWRAISEALLLFEHLNFERGCSA